MRAIALAIILGAIYSDERFPGNFGEAWIFVILLTLDVILMIGGW